MWGKLLSIIIFIISLSGCASAYKDPKHNQIQELQIQVSKLKEELGQRNEEVEYLERKLQETKSRENRFSAEIKKHNREYLMNVKEIQSALKKAGFYDGPIDGKVGRQTKIAIKKFQKSNGLVADGIAGKETCIKLKKYLK